MFVKMWYLKRVEDGKHIRKHQAVFIHGKQPHSPCDPKEGQDHNRGYNKFPVVEKSYVVSMAVVLTSMLY